MIADYDLLKTRLLSELKNKFGNNYILNISDIENALDDIQDSVTSPIVIPKSKLDEIKHLTIDELKTEIKDCLDATISGRYERDNLIILDALTKEFGERYSIGHDIGVYDNCWHGSYRCYKREFEPPKFGKCGWGHSLSLKSCMHEIADNKSNTNKDVLLCGVITLRRWDDTKKHYTIELFRYIPPKDYIVTRLRALGFSDDEIEEKYNKAKYIQIYDD